MISQSPYCGVTSQYNNLINSLQALSHARFLHIFFRIPGNQIIRQALAAFISLRTGYAASDDLRKELNQLVIDKIGKFAMPERIIFSADLPKTRSGKIMRRLLRDVAESRELGNGAGSHPEQRHGNHRVIEHREMVRGEQHRIPRLVGPLHPSEELGAIVERGAIRSRMEPPDEDRYELGEEQVEKDRDQGVQRPQDAADDPGAEASG